MPSMTSPLRPILRAATAAPSLSARAFSTSSPRSLARMIVTGRLAANPEVQSTNTGKELIRYTVVSNSGPRDRRQANFFRITSFWTESPQKDFLLGLQKGSLVFVEGDASMRQWEDAEGKKQSALNINQRNLELLKRPYSEYQGRAEEQNDFTQ